MARYLLSVHSYVRETAGHAIFLDLRRDKYTTLEPEDVRVLPQVLRGWPGRDPSSAEVVMHAEQGERALTLALIREGLITTDELAGKEAKPVEVEAVTTTIDEVPGAFPSITWREFWRFVRAWLQVTTLLRTLPLFWVVNRVRNRKARRRSSCVPFDVKKAHQLMTAYWILRPNFFDPKDACLRDSLTFIEFFALYGLYPTLVFGVKAAPFAAHAWVQEGPMVLNDYIPHVTQFAPILVV